MRYIEVNNFPKAGKMSRWTLKPGFRVHSFTITQTASGDCPIKIGAPAEADMVKPTILFTE